MAALFETPARRNFGREAVDAVGEPPIAVEIRIGILGRVSEAK
jgi:hypothetical protein